MCTQRSAGDALTPVCYLPWFFFPAQTLKLPLPLPALEEALLSAAIFHQWSADVLAKGSVSTYSQTYQSLCCWEKVGSIWQWLENRYWKTWMGGESLSSQVLQQILASFAVLVCSGSYNKIPQTRWLINNRIFFCRSGDWKFNLRVPSLGSQNSRCNLT